jgi:hypothetical protein
MYVAAIILVKAFQSEIREGIIYGLQRLHIVEFGLIFSTVTSTSFNPILLTPFKI